MTFQARREPCLVKMIFIFLNSSTGESAAPCGLNLRRLRGTIFPDNLSPDPYFLPQGGRMSCARTDVLPPPLKFHSFMGERQKRTHFPRATPAFSKLNSTIFTRYNLILSHSKIHTVLYTRLQCGFNVRRYYNFDKYSTTIGTYYPSNPTPTTPTI